MVEVVKEPMLTSWQRGIFKGKSIYCSCKLVAGTFTVKSLFYSGGRSE